MKYATTFLKLLYGGEERPRPAWQTLAIEKLQMMNKGYHPGRFINCLEVTMHAYMGILATQGDFFPNVTPLPNVPPYIPNYMNSLYGRMEDLDATKKGNLVYNISYSFGQLMAYVRVKKLPVYTHLIILAELKKMPGGHALSGIILPSEGAAGFEIFLYDAQGFLPDAWLHADQFDAFYSIDAFYVYDSEHTQKQVQGFVEECTLQATTSTRSDKMLTHLKSSDEILADIKLIKSRLYEFVKLEHFRLGAKLRVGENELLKEKLNEYHGLLPEFAKEVPDEQLYSFIAELFVKTEQLVKKHFYSNNWFNPQSLTNFKTYFEKDMQHTPFLSKYSLNAFSHYLALFLVREIIRIGKEDKGSDNKVTLLLNQLKRVFPVRDDAHLLDVYNETMKICATNRSLTLFNPESKELYQTYLEPLQQKLSSVVSAP